MTDIAGGEAYVNTNIAYGAVHHRLAAVRQRAEEQMKWAGRRTIVSLGFTLLGIAALVAGISTSAAQHPTRKALELGIGGLVTAYSVGRGRSLYQGARRWELLHEECYAMMESARRELQIEKNA